MKEIERIDQMILQLRELKKNAVKMKKLSNKNYMDMTRKAISNCNADKDWIGMDNIRRKHELHALSVEIGVAERRENYEEVVLTDGWHKYPHKPREPFSK